MEFYDVLIVSLQLILLISGIFFSISCLVVGLIIMACPKDIWRKGDPEEILRVGYAKLRVTGS